MLREIGRAALYRPGTPPDLLRGAIRRMSVVAAGFLVSIPVALATEWAYLCWIAMPAVMRGTMWLAVRRRAGRRP